MPDGLLQPGDWQYQSNAQPLVDSQPTDTRTWRPTFPDRIPRLTTRAADQPYFTTGNLAPVFPVADYGWRPSAPDRIWRTILPTAAIPTLALEPFPRPPAPRLFAYGDFPARVLGKPYFVALQPFSSRQNLDPINDPTPVTLVLTEDKLLLGVIDGFAGGWDF